jgi:ketosteroid isomerase-like protein
MPESNEDLVRKAWAAMSRGEIEATLPFCAEDIELIPFGAALHNTVYRGHAGVLVWWQNEIDANWQSFQVFPEEFQQIGDQRLLVFGLWRARGRASEVELDIPATWIVRFADGKIAGWQTYTERNEALRDAGLAEPDSGTRPP